MTADTIHATMRRWEQEPAQARGTPTVKARADGSQAVLEAGPFSWRADLPQPLGGTNQAPSPTALLLSALAGCAVVFIRDTLAPQLGIPVDAVEATVQCEADARGLFGMAGAVPDLQNIRLDIQVQSPASDSELQQLFQAWRERCPIYLALVKANNVSLTMQAVQGEPSSAR